MPRLDQTVVLRVPNETLKRAEALIEPMSNDSTFAPWGKLTRSSIVRLAILEGLESLESKYPTKRKKG